ncbi:MAG: N-acetylneuraminate lyase [Clostridiaceae bacterium]|nr:N-acetylneuraminate lyase [Clostridiaceae bacterium]
MNTFKGIFPALITPYTPGGELNEASLVALVERLIRQGVAGFYAMGSSGECFLLDEAERRRGLEVVFAAAGGRVPVIAQIGSTSTRQSVRLAEHAASLGVAAVSSVSPFYYKYDFAGLLTHYRAIMDAVDLPMIVYNIPSLSGVTYTLDQLQQFGSDPRIVGIKHTSQDLFQLERIRALVPRLTVFNGFDEMFLAGLSMGAHGAIGTTFSFMAPKFIRIQRLYEAGRMADALAEQHSANTVIAALIAAGVFSGTKHFIERQGIACYGCREPMQALHPEHAARLDALLDQLEPLADD